MNFSNFFKTPQEFERPKTLGQLGEEFAGRHYQKLGYKILQVNVYNKKGLRKGEIDFIAQKKQDLVFVEVKTRKSTQSRFGKAEESVNYFKQQKILKAVKLYFAQNRKMEVLRPRIDICVVLYRELDNSLVCDKIISNAVEDYN